MTYLELNLLKKRGHSFKQQLKYTSIDNLPQWNWVQIHKTGNLAYLVILPSYRKLKEDNTKELKELWNEIYDEYLEEFGFSKEYKELLECKRQIAMLKNEYIATSDRSLLNLIEMEELDFKNTFDSSESLGYEEICLAIEKRQGLPINPKELTVYKYNHYIRTLKAQSNG